MFNNVFPANVLSVRLSFVLSFYSALSKRKKITHPPYETKQMANLNIHQVSFPFFRPFLFISKGNNYIYSIITARQIEL